MIQICFMACQILTKRWRNSNRIDHYSETSAKVDTKSISKFPKTSKFQIEKNYHEIMHFCFSYLWILAISNATHDKIRNTLCLTNSQSLTCKKKISSNECKSQKDKKVYYSIVHCISFSNVCPWSLSALFWSNELLRRWLRLKVIGYKIIVQTV